MTSFGLPSYTANDRFTANGGEELVRLPGTSYYRARYEGGFVRYSWLKAPDGKDGYWKAEYPDGSVGYFGADSAGNISAARVSAPGIGTFSYYLVERWDVLGHHRVRASTGLP